MSAVFQQAQSQRETNEIQSKANKQLLMGVVLDNLDKLEEHLNDVARSIYWESEPAADLAKQKSLDKYEKLPLSFIELLITEPPQPGFYRDNLVRELNHVIKLAKAGDVDSFLNWRIKKLAEKLEASVPQALIPSPL
jgi:hypothetical protein